MTTAAAFSGPEGHDDLRARLVANGRRLNSRQLQTLLLRSGLADGRVHTFAEIGVRFGVTHNRIRQIEKAALAALRQRPDLGPYRTDPDEPDLATQLAASSGRGELVALVPPDAPLTVAQARTVLLSRIAPSGDSLRQLLASWLATVESAHSRAAYLRDVSQYLDFCVEQDLDPLAVRVPQFNMFTVWLRMQTTRVGTNYTSSTQNRKISAVSSFYRHLHDAEAVDRNPVTRGARPRYSRAVEDKVLTRDETIALVQDAAAGHPTLGGDCAALVVELLFSMGLRVSEICGLDLDQLSWIERDGHRYRALTFIGKGNKQHVRGIPDSVDVNRLAPYLQRRPRPASLADAPALLLTLDGRRLNRHQVTRLLRRAVRRGVIGRNISPHFGRHTFNRRAEEAGVQIEARQRALGHASVSTTQGYGQARNDVVNDPSHIVAAVMNDPSTHTASEGHHGHDQ